jgi:hypothetical protein
MILMRIVALILVSTFAATGFSAASGAAGKTRMFHGQTKHPAKVTVPEVKFGGARRGR